MENSKEKALKFIKLLKEMNLFYLSVTESFSKYLEYSISVCGKFEETDIFIVSFTKFKTFEPHKVEVSHNTTCKEKINQILNSL